MASITYRKAISRVLKETLDNDPRSFMMGEDIGTYEGAYAVTRGFLDKYGPERIKDTPISESVIVGAGIGAAMGGARPIVELMTINFSLLAIDQIVNSAAKLHYMSGGQVTVPLVIRTVSGGGNQLAASPLPEPGGLVRPCPGPLRSRTLHPLRCHGPFQDSLPGPEHRDVHRALSSLRLQGGGQ